MANVKTCDKTGCSETFDIDAGEGVVQTTFKNNAIVKKYYCSVAHRDDA